MDTERLIHSTKTAIAVCIGTVLARLIGAPADQWVVITILVVMCAQIYVGSLMRKVMYRFLGTVAGCLFATITLMAMGPSNLSILIALMVSSFVFSYLAIGLDTSSSYAATLGAVTVAIILLGVSPTVTFALQRFLEIGAGMVIAALVSQFILPIHASTHLRRAQANTLNQLREYYELAISDLSLQNPDPHDIDEAIAKSIIKQRTLAKESGPETITRRFNPTLFMQSLQCEREMHHAITLMHQALLHLKNMPNVIKTIQQLKSFNDPVIETFNTLVRAMESTDTTPLHIHLPAIDLLKNAIEINAENDVLYIDGFLFAAEVLLQHLKQLAEIMNVSVWKENPDTISVVDA
jgi:uncharacterized membrane protein YccC